MCCCVLQLLAGCVAVSYKCWLRVCHVLQLLAGCVAVSYKCWLRACHVLQLLAGCVAVSYNCWLGVLLCLTTAGWVCCRWGSTRVRTAQPGRSRVPLKAVAWQWVLPLLYWRARLSPSFQIKSKRRRAESFEACCQWVLLNVQITTLLFTLTVQKYIYPSVVILVTSLSFSNLTTGGQPYWPWTISQWGTSDAEN